MTSKRGPCPQCNRGPKDRALSITTDEYGTVAYCFRCGYVEADNRSRLHPVVPTPKMYRRWLERADYIWRNSEPLQGSLAESYLRSRGCKCPPIDGDLRFLPARGNYPPSMVARITDAKTGEPISLHFTRLATDGRSKAGTDRDKLLLGGHRKSGGVIRLWPDDAVIKGLGIAEGIETSLAAAHVFTPVWACVDAGNLAALPVLPGIEALTIYADHDEAGLRAAETCAQRWADAGLEAFIVKAIEQGRDCADLAAA